MVKTFPDVGKRADGKKFSKDIDKIYKSFKIANSTSKLTDKKLIKLSGGDPLDYKPFKLSKRYLYNALKDKNMHKYPAAAGDEYYRGLIAKYLVKEGFNSGENITIDNVIVTMSTTHGFKTILDVIARPYDVVLMPAPCYGLFAFFPERINVDVKFISLDKKDNYYINPQKLNDKINQINKELEKAYNGKLDYIPRVVAFLNQNPHNPTGVVMGNKERELIDSISMVCKKNNVYMIDDLVYRDLTFDKDNLALPMAHNSEFFDNTISLIGLSKSYGYASVRAGAVIANDKIISKMRDAIFQQMDSIPVLQCAMLAGAFNPTKKRYKEYNRYFSKLNKEYEYRYYLLKSIVDGYDSLQNIQPINIKKETLMQAVKQDICVYCSTYKKAKNIMDGIKNVNILENIDVKGGFFVLLDCSGLLGKKDSNNNIITNDVDLFKYLVEQAGIKVIMGSTIGFDSKDMVIRITFALDKKDIVQSLERLKIYLERLV